MDQGDLARENKRPLDQECLVDRWILGGLSRLQPTLKHCGWTPNSITGASLTAGLLSVYFLWHDSLSLFLLFFGSSYILDCADGQMARRYHMESSFGDWFDHITDLLVLGLLFAVIVRRFGPILQPVDITVLLLLLTLCLMSIGCQQESLGPPAAKTGASLEPLRGLCPVKNCQAPPAWVQCFGCGNCTVLFMMYVAWLVLRWRRHGQQQTTTTAERRQSGGGRCCSGWHR